MSYTFKLSVFIKKSNTGTKSLTNGPIIAKIEPIKNVKNIKKAKYSIKYELIP